MKAYTKGVTKAEFVLELKNHQAADDFIKGSYSRPGDKGCAISCSLKSIANIKNLKNISISCHKNYEKYLGIPEWLALVEDTIFEGVSLKKSKIWPVEFSEAINEGANLHKVRLPFIIYILEQNLLILTDLKTENDLINEAIIQGQKAVIQMLAAQKSKNKKLIIAAQIVVKAASELAQSVESALWSSWSILTSQSAESKARLALWSTAWIVSSAASSSWSAAESSMALVSHSVESSVRAIQTAVATALNLDLIRSTVYEKYADKLLSLLRVCN